MLNSVLGLGCCDCWGPVDLKGLSSSTLFFVKHFLVKKPFSDLIRLKASWFCFVSSFISRSFFYQYSSVSHSYIDNCHFN